MITKIEHRYSTNDALGDWTDPETGVDHTPEAWEEYGNLLRKRITDAYPGALVTVEAAPPGDLVDRLTITSDQEGEDWTDDGSFLSSDASDEERQAKTHIEHLMGLAYEDLCGDFQPF